MCSANFWKVETLEKKKEIGKCESSSFPIIALKQINKATLCCRQNMEVWATFCMAVINQLLGNLEAFFNKKEMIEKLSGIADILSCRLLLEMFHADLRRRQKALLDTCSVNLTASERVGFVSEWASGHLKSIKFTITVFSVSLWKQIYPNQGGGWANHFRARLFALLNMCLNSETMWYFQDIICWIPEHSKHSYSFEDNWVFIGIHGYFTNQRFAHKNLP